MRYSNDEERAAAKRAAKKKYYEKNKGNYRMWAMQWRHENQPPLYIQETAKLERELVSLEESYERKKAVIEQHLERLKSWDPLQANVSEVPSALNFNELVAGLVVEQRVLLERVFVRVVVSNFVILTSCIYNEAVICSRTDRHGREHL